MKFPIKPLFILTLTSLFYSSCTDEEFLEDEIAFGVRNDRSLSEYENLAANPTANMPDFAPVVSFTYSLNGSASEDYIASGVLISDQWILTAGHNFYDATEQSNPAPVSGISVHTGNDPNNPDATYSVLEIVYHPTWLAGFQEYSHANDLCLVKIDQAISSITPATIHSQNTESVGTEVWHGGFGDYSQTSGQNPDVYSKKHAIHNTLDRVVSGFTSSTGGTSYVGGLIAFDFDDPDGLINSLGDSYVGEDEALLGSGTSSAGALDYEGTTIEGDSGGPLFVKVGQTWEVGGILGGGAFEPIQNHSDASYGDISIYTRVSTSAEWILSVIQ